MLDVVGKLAAVLLFAGLGMAVGVLLSPSAQWGESGMSLLGLGVGLMVVAIAVFAAPRLRGT